MFMISTFLYSAKYWPDVYNYINANITIKRIPTISELELTVIEVVDYTTEQPYTSTDGDYIEVSTVDDLDIDEFMKDEIDFTKKVKRHIEVEQLKDYIELPPRPIFVDYVFIEEPMKQEIDPKKLVDNHDSDIPKEMDKDIMKTLVTGVIIEDDLPKNTVSEDPAVTKKYYTVQPTKSKASRRSINEEVYTTELPKQEVEHTTTIEGYLVGDAEEIERETEVPIVITTKANENELFDDEDDTGLMKDSVDVSNLSTRSPDDVEMVTRKPWKMQMLIVECEFYSDMS
uniref:SFRICE_033199 n=1 Tax=Spodoptera frugiperda TaxID=7108 RepID=A0A2H1WNV5_SPOFR